MCVSLIKQLTFFFCSRLKAPRAPDTTFFSGVIGDAFAVAIVGFAINISLSKIFGLKYGYKVDSNQVRKAYTHSGLHKQYKQSSDSLITRRSTTLA